MFVGTELIEETGRPPGLIFWHVGVFFVWIRQVRILEKIYTFDEVRKFTEIHISHTP